MDGYTKINGTNNTSNKSRSKDFSDLLSFTQPHKTNENLSPNHNIFHDIIDLESISKSQQSKNQESHDDNEKENEDAIANEEKMKGNNNNIPSGVKLSRACSVSSAASANRLRLERQGSKSTTTSSFQSVKRVFSMRRSSSVSEKYCRIHDQGFTISSPILDDVAEAHENMEKKEKKSGSARILKAFKRVLAYGLLCIVHHSPVHKPNTLAKLMRGENSRFGVHEFRMDVNYHIFIAFISFCIFTCKLSRTL